MRYEDDWSKIPTLPHDEQRELALLWLNEGDQSAVDKLLYHNMRFLIYRVRQLIGDHEPFIPYMGDAAEGFMMGLNKWDPDRGVNVLGYCRYWIDRCVRFTRHLEATELHVPIIMLQRRPEILSLLDEGKSPNEIAKELGHGLGTIISVLEAFKLKSVEQSREDMSAHSKDSDEMEYELTHHVDEEYERERKDCIMEIRGVLDDCGIKDINIIKLRYGIGCKPHSLQEVADIYGVSRERIRQRQSRALEKLRDLLGNGYDSWILPDQNWTQNAVT